MIRFGRVGARRVDSSFVGSGTRRPRSSLRVLNDGPTRRPGSAGAAHGFLDRARPFWTGSLRCQAKTARVVGHPHSDAWVDSRMSGPLFRGFFVRRPAFATGRHEMPPEGLDARSGRQGLCMGFRRQQLLRVFRGDDGPLSQHPSAVANAQPAAIGGGDSRRNAPSRSGSGRDCGVLDRGDDPRSRGHASSVRSMGGHGAPVAAADDGFVIVRRRGLPARRGGSRGTLGENQRLRVAVAEAPAGPGQLTTLVPSSRYCSDK